MLRTLYVRATSMIVRWTPFAARLVLAAMLALSVRATAQTYVRPSNGATVTVFSNIGNAAGTQTSAVFNTTGFSAARLTLIPSSTCSSFSNVVITTQGSTTSTGTFTTVTDSFAVYGATSLTTSPVSYTVANLAPYTRFTMPNFTALPAGCTLSVVMVPLAFSPVVYAEGRTAAGDAVVDQIFPVVFGGSSYTIPPDINVVKVNSAGAISVTTTGSGGTTTAIAPTTASFDTTATGTQVFAANASACSVTVQNVCTASVTCGHGNVTSGGPGLVLKAATGAAVGDGGSWTAESGALIKCISSSGTCSVTIQPEACP